MDRTSNITSRIRTNFYLNSLNFIFFLIITITGLIIQVNYHMHNLPDGYTVLGLSRHGWILAHKASTAAALAGIILHCLLHLKYISVVTKKIINKTSGSTSMTSYYLLIICFFTAVTAIIPWFFLDRTDPSRFFFLEIHDKLALLFIIFSTVHILSRTKWMVKTYQKL